MSKKAIILWIVGLFLGAIALAIYFVWRSINTDAFAVVFNENCATCHGENLQGTNIGPALVGTDLQHGDSIEELSASIARGFPEKGMPPWRKTMDDGSVQSLAIYVAEQRANRPFLRFNTDKALEISAQIINTELHDFRMEVLTDQLDPLPFSIAPQPDGGFLVTEKTKGLRIVSAGGELSDYIQGVPQAFDDTIDIGPLEVGLGWLMDVAPHPDYARNGWIYLHFGDRCEECGEGSLLPVSMNTLIRGRIVDGAWTDEEVIWKAAANYYSTMTDMAAGGRIAFDHEGAVFMSIGMKGPSNFEGGFRTSPPRTERFTACAKMAPYRRTTRSTTLPAR